MVIELRIYRNKKTNQLFVPLPRKKLEIKEKDPVSIEIDNIRMKFEEIKRRKFL